MAFKKTFVVSDETPNCYNFIVRTTGIRLVDAKKNCPCFYSHNRNELPLGHWDNFRIEGTQLLADVNIDGESELEKTYIRKIQNGDIKGATIGADPETWNVDGEVPVLEICNLFEISLEALPGNKNALALMKDKAIVKLSMENKDTIIPTIKKVPDMKAIALKLGLSETATESEILVAIGEVLLKNKTAEAFSATVLDGVADGLTEEQKETFVELKKSNPGLALKFATNAKVASVLENATTEVKEGKVVADVKVSTLLRKPAAAAAAVAADGKESYDYLQKNNPVELARIHKEEPAKYTQLAGDYAKGVRYTGK